MKPGFIQLIEFLDRPDTITFLAQIPLSEEGGVAVTTNNFNGQQPDPAHIQRPGLTPAAIYVWLIYTPGVLGRALGAIETILILPKWLGPARSRWRKIMDTTRPVSFASGSGRLP